MNKEIKKQLEEIQETYMNRNNIQLKKLAYAYISDLICLVSDNTLKDLISNNELINKTAKMDSDNMIKEISIEEFQEIINAIKEALENEKKELSEDEYEAMTQSEVLDYIDKIWDKDKTVIYEFIKVLETL